MDGDQRIEQLERDLAEAIERQAATSQVLEVIGRGASELEPVFETVLRQAVRLCRADAGLIHVLQEGAYWVASALGGSAEYRDYLRSVPIVPGPGTLVGRVGQERRTVQIPDVLADPDYRMHRARELGGFRTILGVPMLAAERVVGVMVLWRHKVAPFDARTIGLVTTFAAQGAIAIQNAELLLELRRRERELARSVDEQRALGEISQAVGSTLDLDEVLTTIVTRAVRLSGADGGSIFEFQPGEQVFVLRTCSGTSAELAERLRGTRIALEETFIGRAAARRAAQQAPDLAQEAPDPHITALLEGGWRSMLAVPLLREDEIIGALIVRRTEPGAFPDRTVELLETLASQSAVAIHNARLYSELARKSGELEVAGRHKSEFLASMSHELRTPLNAVIGFSDVLLERMAGELNERQEEYVVDIRDSGRHLLELINEILDLSKVEAGRMELDPGPLSLPDLLEQGLAMVRERAERGGLAVTLDVAPDVGVVWADELKLKQVVINLLTNAVKFTPDGGAVEVTARVEDDEVQVTVRDTGIGISEHERERIFEAFQRGDRPARSTAEGTGLGLTLSRRIVELHGGRLWLTSRPGAGSTFGFALPLRRGAAAEASPGGQPGDPAAADVVLVIEDDPSSAHLLGIYLDDAGYETRFVHDGAEGLELARALRPRAVVLDILLPRVDGWDLLARLKADPATAYCPVVIVSILDERAKGLSLGASEYLVKPVGREQLLAALEVA